MFPILDACCGGKMFYFDKNDSRVLFQDIREIETELCDGRHFEVKPDVIGDFTNMKFEDNSFSMVVFDPPHLKYTGSKKECDGWQMTKYGHLGKDWKDTLQKGFKECFRVLKPGGFLIFKWNETDIKVTEILKLTTAKPIFGHISGKRANTHWICFMKEEGMQYIITKDEMMEMVHQEVVKIIDGKIDKVYETAYEKAVEKATQWLYDHLTTEYQGAVLKIVAKDKGKMPVEFVEEFKTAMLESYEQVE